ncbi:hypothetical protein Hanom_Chr08g00750391 [Helianthus anomalus]
MQVGVILDIGSGVGKVIYRCITMDISDFYKANPHYITRIVFNTTDTKGEPLIALYAGMPFFLLYYGVCSIVVICEYSFSVY